MVSFIFSGIGIGLNIRISGNAIHSFIFNVLLKTSKTKNLEIDVADAVKSSDYVIEPIDEEEENILEQKPLQNSDEIFSKENNLNKPQNKSKRNSNIEIIGFIILILLVLLSSISIIFTKVIR